MRKLNHNRFISLREKYPVFTYESYHFTIKEDNTVEVSFHFRIGPDIDFRPVYIMNAGKYALQPLHKDEMDGIVFHIGMVEMISYWKATCSPQILIRPSTLTVAQQKWWKKLFWHGLGEFLYQNSIETDEEQLVSLCFEQGTESSGNFQYHAVIDSNRVLVPVGGGKDSVVTLESLRHNREIIPFIINPREATLECARVAGFDSKEDMVLLKRMIDPLLLELNNRDFLNGHTPFSAMLAFWSLLASHMTGTREIALSNESSANEPTIPGTSINHQYSKSLEFELDFRDYVRQYMGDIAHYYSFLRPYNEWQIAELFSHYPDYFPVFKSCNSGSKEDKWCCDCSKCLFTYIILSPFLEEKELIAIFGEDLLDKPSLVHYFDELTGLAEVKPFECVGTLEEVNRAIQAVKDKYKDKYLIQHYINHKS